MHKTFPGWQDNRETLNPLAEWWAKMPDDIQASIRAGASLPQSFPSWKNTPPNVSPRIIPTDLDIKSTRVDDQDEGEAKDAEDYREGRDNGEDEGDGGGEENSEGGSTVTLNAKGKGKEQEDGERLPLPQGVSFVEVRGLQLFLSP